MKKGKILKTLTIAGLVLGASFGLAGCGSKPKDTAAETQIKSVYAMAVENGYQGSYEEWLESIKGEKGADGANVELRVFNGYIQWKTTDETSWKNLIALSEIQGQDGAKGQDGDQYTIGADGYWYKNGFKTEYKAVGEDGTNADVWTIGSDGYWYKNGTKTDNKAKGADGKDATYTTYTVTFDYGKAKDLFDNNIDSATIKSTEWLTSLPTIKDDYKNSFSGWYISDTNKQIEKYDFIGGNITLEARFDYELLGLSGLYQNGKYVMTWNDLLTTYPDAFILNNTQIKGDVDVISKSYFKSLSGEMVIDNSITSIGRSAFYDCTSLTNIIIPNTITTIGDYGFYYCTLLDEINLPDSVVTLGSNAFGACEGLERIKMPSELKSIGNNCFIGCENLIEIEIPNSVTTMGWSVFSGCDKISSINIPEKLEQIDIKTFSGMKGVEIINYNAVKLKDFTLEDYKNAGDVFARVGHNVDLVTINIGPKVERIPSYLFDMFYTFNNASISYDTKFVVNFKNAINCQSIGEYAFDNLRTVENIILSNHLTSIEIGAFANCYNLKEIYFYGTEEEWSGIAISEQGEYFTNATKYYFSAVKPTTEGNYWHYDIDGVTPIAW